MDVVKIWEFDTLKFQGFIRNITYSGAMQTDGKPQRMGVIDATGMTGLLMESAVSFNLGFIDPETTDSKLEALLEAAATLFETVVDSGSDGNTTYSEIVQAVIDGWLSAVDELVGTGYRNYFERYIDYTTGLSSEAAPGLPRDLNKLFTGMEQQLTIWDILQKLIEAPFQELWGDEGPRQVSLDQSPTDLQEEKSYVIMRQTPFNGAISFTTGAKEDRFDAMTERKIPLDYLLSFSWSRTMDESYSVFFAVPVVLQVDQQYAAASGSLAINEETLAKHLYRPLQYNLYYIRSGGEANSASVSDTERKASNASQTLKNWFEHNDKYLNGTIRIMVPDETDIPDIRIGERVAIEGINGHFYVESVSHTWQYGGTLAADIGLTRGWDYQNQSQVKLVNSIFSRATTS
jgi:hypothetical protein